MGVILSSLNHGLILASYGYLHEITVRIMGMRQRLSDSIFI
ncbi:hypothetical protein RintRC_2165 [Richelia intracellularis]|nr:hypothetical protein RintRC_2165 [Richelia intracellularis]